MLLRKIREEHGLTQAQLARGAGISQTCLNRYELEKRKLSVETAKKLAAVLGCEWTEFFES